MFCRNGRNKCAFRAEKFAIVAKLVAMKVVFYSSKSYDIEFFRKSGNQLHHQLDFLETQLNEQTAVLAEE